MENKIASYVDHTILSQCASKEEILTLCKEAKEHNFKSVCINPSYIELASKELKDSDVLVCTVIGFPLGQMTTASKVFETKQAIEIGADEIDMVINISKLKENDVEFCINEINEIKKACGNKTLKVIVETCLLSEEEIIRAANVLNKTNADFIKTSTRFSKSGADIKDIIIWKKILNPGVKIKAAGGIRTYQDALNFINAGVDRIGASAGIKLLSKI